MPSDHKAILCLCHDETTLRVRQMLLEHFGYRVFPTRSVDKVGSLVRESCPDMLLMDHSYPGLDCQATAERAKQICPDLLAVVLSPTYAVRRGNSGSVDRFLGLDETPADLAAAIQLLFEGRRGPDPGIDHHA